MKLMRKISVAVLSAIIFSLTLAFFEYTPSAQRQAGGGYFPLDALFVIYFFYSIPVYLIGGIPYSHYADKYLKNIEFRNGLLKYILHFLVYIAGGLVIAALLLTFAFLIDGDVSGLLLSNVFIACVYASLLFFHMSLIVNAVLKTAVK